MHWVLLKATAETAIAVPRRFEAGNLYESMPEIAGTTVRGAFANAYLRLQGGQPDSNFEQWFENHAIRFGPLRPLPKEVVNIPENASVLPMPRSARSCKYEDGLPEGGHGVFDWLLEVAEKQEPTKQRDKFNCPECGAPIEPLEKPWLIADWKKHFGVDYKPDLRLMTHVGIGAVGTEEMNLAMEGRLFSLQSFPAGTEFHGWIAIRSGNVYELLKQLNFKQVNEEMWEMVPLLHVGRRSSTYGALKIMAQVVDKPPWQETHGDFERRWEEFQKKFWNRFGSPERLNLRVKDVSVFNGAYVFSVTFVTDTILLDEFLRPYRVLTAGEVARRLGLRLETSKVSNLATFARPQVVRGWNTAHKLPKEQDIAIAAGSVFLFAVQRDAIEESELKLALKCWEEQGIGWRRSEGFGQVLICDPWHLRLKHDESVPLRWERGEMGPTKRRGLDEKVVEFLRQTEDALVKSGLSRTQLEKLKERAHHINATRQLGRDQNPCERLKEYLEHQAKRKTKGWVHKVSWQGKEQAFAYALIDVLGLNTCNWEVALSRVDDFVLATLVLLNGRKLEEKFSLRTWLSKGEKEYE